MKRLFVTIFRPNNSHISTVEGKNYPPRPLLFSLTSTVRVRHQPLPHLHPVSSVLLLHPLNLVLIPIPTPPQNPTHLTTSRPTSFPSSPHQLPHPPSPPPTFSLPGTIFLSDYSAPNFLRHLGMRSNRSSRTKRCRLLGTIWDRQESLRWMSLRDSAGQSNWGWFVR